MRRTSRMPRSCRARPWPMCVTMARISMWRPNARSVCATKSPPCSGCPPARSMSIPQMMSGQYGRGNCEDASIEAVLLSRTAGRPVQVQWSRAEEFRLSPQRPVFDAELEAGIDAHGAITGWRCAVRTNSYLVGSHSLGPGVPEETAGRDAEPALSPRTGRDPPARGTRRCAHHIVPLTRRRTECLCGRILHRRACPCCAAGSDRLPPRP